MGESRVNFRNVVIANDPESKSTRDGRLIEYCMGVFCGKWKWIVITLLHREKILRYTEIKAMLQKPTHKILSQQLRELEQDGLVLRKSYNEVPPRVEYSLTQKGLEIMPLIEEMLKWGRKYREDVVHPPKKGKTYW